MLIKCAVAVVARVRALAIVATLVSVAAGAGAALAAGRSVPLGGHGVWVSDAGVQRYVMCGPGYHCPAQRPKGVARLEFTQRHRGGVLVSAVLQAVARSRAHTSEIRVLCTLDGHLATAGRGQLQQFSVHVNPGSGAAVTAPFQAVFPRVRVGRHRLTLLVYAGGMHLGPVSLVETALTA